MILKDIQIKCKECGDMFTFTVKDQNYFAEKGWHKPRRCKSCRRLRREGVIGDGEKKN